jgi:hypothetical protein
VSCNLQLKGVDKVRAPVTMRKHLNGLIDDARDHRESKQHFCTDTGATAKQSMLELILLGMLKITSLHGQIRWTC